jgi:hypothetical protein
VGGRCGSWGRLRHRSARRRRREPARRGGKADRWGKEDCQPAERCEGSAGSGDAASCGAWLRWCWSVVHLGDSFSCLGGCFLSGLFCVPAVQRGVSGIVLGPA